MFAVPGWSVPVANLKPQTKDLPAPRLAGDASINDSRLGSKKGKKRKKSGSASGGTAVTSENLPDLWAKVIEGRTDIGRAAQKDTTGPDKKRRKRSKKDRGNATDGVHAEQKEQSSAVGADSQPTESEPKTKNEAKSKTKKKIQAPKSQLPSTLSQTADSATTSTLTPLQASMRQKLISARFRHLNQTLYTTPSDHSLSLFATNPEMFAEYHAGFRNQVSVWPSNPVDGYIVDIETRAAVRNSPGRPITGPAPLPRTHTHSTIADLGCGDASLAQALEGSKASKLKLRLHSFDLQSAHPLITAADIANLPLPAASVDVAIFCLALMGTNWLDFIDEAFRVLRWKGELWVAEIKSRFGRVERKKAKGGPEGGASLGKKKKDRPEDMALAEEDVEGGEAAQMPQQQQTDVSAFVEVLRKRGFVLRQEDGRDAVDTTNKMFVKMSFVKGITPARGKAAAAAAEAAAAAPSSSSTEKGKRKRFIENNGAEDAKDEDEAKVLKPCVYKTR